MKNSAPKMQWVEELKCRIKIWVVDTLNFCETLPLTQVVRNINFQLIKSVTSVGANHRAACRARSDAEFFAKLSIAVEEADESHYWLEIIEAKGINCDKSSLLYLLKEAAELTKILSTSRYKAGQKLRRK